MDILKNLSHYCHKVAWIGCQQITEPKDSIFSNGLSATFVSLLWNSQEFRSC